MNEFPPDKIDAAALQTAHEIVALPEDWNCTRKKAAIQVIVTREMMRCEMESKDPLHPNTRRLVGDFSKALAEKLAKAEQKYGYRDNWLTDDWEADCRAELMRHIEKGDPLDVAAYCAFMWRRGWSTKQP